MKLLLTADFSAARVNKDLMPQQTLMELLVQGFDDIAVFQNGVNQFRDISTWEKVLIEDRSIIDINWMTDPLGSVWGDEFLDAIDDNSPVQPGGSIDLQWIPNSVIRFDIDGLDLSGVVETSLLPPKLISFVIDNNKLFGTFDTSALPQTLEEVSLFRNKFSGSLQLEKLPPKLNNFNAGNNTFSGSLNLTRLPRTLTSLLLNANDFTGSVDLQCIPRDIKVIYLHENNFYQSEIRIRTDLKCLTPLKLDKDSFETLLDSEGNPVTGVKEILSFAQVVIQR